MTWQFKKLNKYLLANLSQGVDEDHTEHVECTKAGIKSRPPFRCADLTQVNLNKRKKTECLKEITLKCKYWMLLAVIKWRSENQWLDNQLLSSTVSINHNSVHGEHYNILSGTDHEHV